MRKISRRGSSFSKIRTTCSFYVVLQLTARKCKKINHARTEPMLYSRHLLFGDYIVSLPLPSLVCLRSVLQGGGGADRDASPS